MSSIVMLIYTILLIFHNYNMISDITELKRVENEILKSEGLDKSFTKSKIFINQKGMS